MWMDYSTITMLPGGVLPSSEYYRYMLVLRGNGRFVSGGDSYDISLHSFFTVPVYTAGRLESDSDAPFHLGCIEIRDHRSSSQRIMVLPPESTEFARRVFYLGIDMQDCAMPHYDKVNSALHRLMFSLLVAAGMSSQTMNEQVYRVIDEVNNHFTDADFDVRDIIGKTGYTVNHFRKIFKQETGVTPSDFVNHRRIERSEELLAQFGNAIPVKDIAVQCGFRDPYYFSRLFKKEKGVSPQAFIDKRSI